MLRHFRHEYFILFCCLIFVVVLKVYFSLPRLFVFLFDVLSVAVFVSRDRFVKNKIKADSFLKL